VRDAALHRAVFSPFFPVLRVLKKIMNPAPIHLGLLIDCSHATKVGFAEASSAASELHLRLAGFHQRRLYIATRKLVWGRPDAVLQQTFGSWLEAQQHR
jgi:hypothetical protein